MQVDARILLVDTDRTLRAFTERVLADRRYAVTMLSDPAEVFPLRGGTDLVLLVARDPILPTLACYARLRREHPRMPVLVLGPGAVGDAVDPADRVAVPYEVQTLLARIAVRLRAGAGNVRRLHDWLIAREHTSVDAEQLIIPQMEQLPPGERIARLLARRGERG